MTDEIEDTGLSAVTPPGLLAFGLPEPSPVEEEENPFGRDPDARPVGFVERMGAAFRAGVRRETLVGAGGTAAGAAALRNPATVDAIRLEKERLEDESETPRPGETPLAARLRSRAARRRRERGIRIETPEDERRKTLDTLTEWESIPDASTPLDYLATTLGMIGAGATSPEGWITGPTGWLAKVPGVGRLFAGGARPTAQAIAEAAIVQGGVNLATDPPVQGLNIAAGVQSGYDPLRTLLAGPIGAGLGGTIAGAGIAARKAFSEPTYLGDPWGLTGGQRSAQFPMEGPAAPAPGLTPPPPPPVVARLEIGSVDPMAKRPGDPPPPAPVEAPPSVAAPATARLAEQPALGEVRTMIPPRSDDPTLAALQDTLVTLRGNEKGDAITVWHGTPHDFGEKPRFDLSKLGTGEGSQIEGIGHYVAGRKEVGEWYRNTLTEDYSVTVDGKPYNPDNPSHYAALALDEYGGDYGKAREDIGTRMADAEIRLRGLEGEIENMKGVPDAEWPLRDAYVDGVEQEKKLISRFQAALSLLNEGNLLPSVKRDAEGFLYQARIKAKPDEFLQWDEPLSAQPHILEKAAKIWMGVTDNTAIDTPFKFAGEPAQVKKVLGEWEGQEFIRMLEGQAGREEASRLLSKAGIKGTRYLDGETRGGRSDEPNYNYVIFDDDTLEIVGKNGKPVFHGREARDFLQGKYVQPMTAKVQIPEAAKQAIKLQDEVAATPKSVQPQTAIAAAPPSPGKPAGVFMFDATKLKVDPERFQFKSETDAEGVSTKLKSVKEWDPAKVNQIIVWQAADGSFFVADGHQRTGLARRLSVEGKPTEIPGLLYRETDGWSPQDVMVLAAEKNIGEGSGTIVDAAKIMRLRPNVGKNLEGISDHRIRQASDLAGLGDEPWRMVLNEVVEPEQAAVVGRFIRGDEARQLAAISAIERGRPANLDETAALVRKVAQSELVKQNEKAQSSLFGDDFATSTVMEEIRIAAQAAKLVRSDKALFSRVLNDADRIEAAGSNINRSAAASIKDDAGRIAAYIASQADTPGPIRTALLKLAREVKDGTRSYADAARTLVEDVRRANDGNDPARLGAGVRAGGEGPAAPVAGTEQTAAGQQNLIPGVAPVTDKQRLEVQAAKPLQGGKAELPPGGIFDQDALNQDVLFRMQSQQRALAQLQAAGQQVNAPPAGPSPQIMSLQQQVLALDAALDLPTRQGRLQRGQALGQYDPRQGVVRLQTITDFETQSHEIGHAIEQRVGAPIGALQQAHIGELSNFGNVVGPGALPEAFAEFVATYMTNPAFARQQAPVLFGQFETVMAQRAPAEFAAMRAAQDAHQAYINAPSEAKLEAIVVLPDRDTVKQRIKDLGFFPTARLGIAKTYEAIFDDKEAVLRAVRMMTGTLKERTGQLVDLKEADNPNVLLRLAERAHQGALFDMQHGVRSYHDPMTIGTSLHEAIKLALGNPVLGKWDDAKMAAFGEYLVARRAEWLWERYNNGTLKNRPLALTVPDVQAAIATHEAANPNIRAAADMVHQYTRDILKKMYDGHLIDKDFYDKLMGERFYVPFYRDMRDKPEILDRTISEGGGAPGGKTPRGPGMVEPVKAIKGSDRDIINPIRGLMFQSFLVNRTIAHNDAVLSMVRLAQRVGGQGRLVDTIPAKDMKAIRFDLYEALNAAAKQHNINPIDAQFLTNAVGSVYGNDPIMASIFRSKTTAPNGEPILFYREGGELKAVRMMNEKEGMPLFEAFTSMPNVAANLYTQIIGSAAWTLQRGIVTHPTYALTNYIRDQIQATVMVRGFVPVWSGAKGLASEVTQGPSALAYASMGGVTPGAAVGSVNKAIEGDIQALAKRGFAVNRLTSLNGLIELAGSTETGTRVGIYDIIYKREIAAGRSPHEAAIAAAWHATDFTDWSRHGSKTETFRHLVPFLNAAIVGFDKANRAFVQPFLRAPVTVQDKQAKVDAQVAMAKLGMLATAGFLWAWWQSGNEAYDDAGGKLKATHLVASLGNGTVAVIPKPFDYAGFAMSVGEEAYSRFIAKDPRAVDRLTESLAENVLSPLNPQRWLFDAPGLKTGYELALNRNMFTGRDIVPDELKNLPPNERVVDRTSPVAKWAAKAINAGLSPFTEKGVSPIQMDHVVGSLFGLYGRDLIAVSRQADAIAKEGATPGWEDTVMARRYIKPETVVRDTLDKFWKLAADRTGLYGGSVKRYEDLLKRFSDAEASEFLSKMKPAQRAYVTLSSAVDEFTGRKKFSPDDRRMHPAVRGADAAHVIAGFMKELDTNSQVDVLTGDRIKIDPDTRGNLIRHLRVLQVMEMQHALTVLGEEGYSGRKLPPVKEQIEVIRAINKEAGDELAQRYAQKKIFSAEASALVWPEVRKRVIEEGGEADLSDLRASVMGEYEFGAIRQRRAAQKRRVPIPPVRTPPVELRP